MASYGSENLTRGGLYREAMARTDGAQPFLSQIERGRAQPSMSSLHRIARALGTVTPELLSAAEIAPVGSQAEIDSAAVYALVTALRLQCSAVASGSGVARVITPADSVAKPLRTQYS